METNEANNNKIRIPRGMVNSLLYTIVKKRNTSPKAAIAFFVLTMGNTEKAMGKKKMLTKHMVNKYLRYFQIIFDSGFYRKLD